MALDQGSATAFGSRLPNLKELNKRALCPGIQYYSRCTPALVCSMFPFEFSKHQWSLILVMDISGTLQCASFQPVNLTLLLH